MFLKKTFTPLITLIALIAAGCGAPDEQESATAGNGDVYESIHHNFRVTTVVDGLHHPWAIAFLPNGDKLVTERGSNSLPAQLRIIRDGELLPDPVPGLPEIRTGGQGGLLDVIPHPDFENNNLIYISYSKPNDDGSEGTTAVIRGTFENDQLQNVEEIFEAQAWTGGQGHYGSRLAFDHDGYLFVTVGDRQANPGGGLEAQQEHPSQDLSNHYGTVNRIHDDGSVPSDNPFLDEEGALPEIWSYGHRNPQALAVHPETNDVWATEHGPQGGDELNHIRPGVNYGWPIIGFGVNYGAGSPLHEIINRDELELPVHHWTPSIAPAGMAIYSGDQFPQWQGSFFAGGMSGQYQILARVTVQGTDFVAEEVLLPGEYRIRDVREGPDGYIYLAIDDRGGEATPIVRLEPAQ
ncbi:MAG: PQQ-dependent sugar dehydrogenase [Balneolaceae bacterium]